MGIRLALEAEYDFSCHNFTTLKWSAINNEELDADMEGSLQLFVSTDSVQIHCCVSLRLQGIMHPLGQKRNDEG